MLKRKAVRTRLELATPCVTGMYSNQLNYRTYSFVLRCKGSAICGMCKLFERFFLIFCENFLTACFQH